MRQQSYTDIYKGQKTQNITPRYHFFHVNAREKRLPQQLQGTNLKHASFHGEHADIEGSAPQVEDDDVRSRDSRVLGLLVPVEAVCQGGSRGLVDDAAYVEPLEKKTRQT